MSIRRKVILIISSLLLILSMTTVGVVTSVLYNHTIRTNGESGLMILRGIAEIIDTDKVMKIFKERDMKDPGYLELVKEFTEIVEHSNLLYLYTVHYDEEGSVRYGIVADGLDDTLGLALLEGDINREILESLNQGTEHYTSIYTREQWGTYMSCSIPLRNAEGNIVGALATDISQDNIRKVTLNISIKISAVIILFITIIGGLIYAAIEKIITKPNAIDAMDISDEEVNPAE